MSDAHNLSIKGLFLAGGILAVLGVFQALVWHLDLDPALYQSPL